MHCLRVAYASGKKPWVARITGLSKTFGLKRDFVPMLHDYNSLQVGPKEIMCCFFLEAGEVYEVCEDPERSKKARYYCRITHKDELERIPLEEVMAAINLQELAEDVAPRKTMADKIYGGT